MSLSQITNGSRLLCKLNDFPKCSARQILMLLKWMNLPKLLFQTEMRQVMPASKVIFVRIDSNLLN